MKYPPMLGRIYPVIWAVILIVPSCLGLRGFCPLRCRCNDDKLQVHCDDASLDVVPITLNPGIKELYLSRNNIKNIMGSQFTVYGFLEILDVSHNQLSNLGKNNFHLRHLRLLDLSNNNISVVTPETFRGLQNVNEMTLKRNSVAELPGRAFHDMRNLEVLDLSHNHLNLIDSSAFVGLVRLQKLILRSNTFEEMPSNAFVHLSHLHTLDFGANVFNTVPDHAFHHLSRLRELYLDRCGVLQFEPAAFNGLVSLISVNLQYNNLEQFPSEALSEMHKLEELSIGGNRFTRLSSSDLRPLPSLKKFVLTQSETFERIAGDAFNRTANIEQVIIENNKNFQCLPATLFQQLPKLRHISIRGNSLKYIDPAAIPVDQLESFDVTKNPLVCNCSIEWLWHHIRLHESLGYHNSSAARCAAPANLQHEFIKNLAKIDLDCDGPTRRNILILGIVSTLVLSVIASIVGIWYRRRALTVLKTKQIDSSSISAPMVEHHHHPYLTQSHFAPVHQSPYHASSYYSSQHTLNTNTLNSTGYLISNPMDNSNHVYMTVGPPSPQHKPPQPPSPPPITRCNYYTITAEKKYQATPLAYI